MRSMLARVGLAIVAATALSIALAVPADAKLRVLAIWKVTISGSVRHDWTYLDPDPCMASGSGWVSARFAGVRAERITIADSGFAVGDFSWGGSFDVRGKITAVDARTRNPPGPSGECVNPGPVPDTRGCVTRRLSSGVTVLPPLQGVRRGYFLDGDTFSNALDQPDGILDCELGGFTGFAMITGDANTQGQELRLPGYPTVAKLRSRRGKIVVNASQRRRFQANTTTTRQVRLVFTRVR